MMIIWPNGAMGEVECGDDLQAAADAKAAEIDAEYTPEKLRNLIANEGRLA